MNQLTTKLLKMIYPAAKVILISPSKKDQFLLVKRTIDGLSGYEAAGGRVEADIPNLECENYEQCAVREIKEELGVDIEILNYLGSYSFFWSIKPNTCSCCVVYLGRILSGEVSAINMDPNERSFESEWISTQAILDSKINIRENHSGLRPILLQAVSISKTI